MVNQRTPQRPNRDSLAVYRIVASNAEGVAAAYYMLADENDRSMHHLYGDSLDQQQSERYPYLPGGEITPTQLAGLLDSYDYQSCEHPDYRTSQVAEWIRLLREAISERHGIAFNKIDYTSPDYPWSVCYLAETDNDAWYRTAETLKQQVTTCPPLNENS